MQTKRGNIMRFIALLCLFALTVGCTACAIACAKGVIDESDSDVESVDSVTPDGTDGTESNAEQSEKPGEPSVEVSVDQSAKELMVPVGTKTTVEKIASYPIGEEEAFQYAFEYCEPFDSEEAYSPTIPYYAQIDENEDLYLGYWWDTATRLRDGKQWESTYSWKTSYPEGAYYRFVISGEYLYMMYDNGVVEQYDMEGNLVKLHTGCADRGVDAMIPYVDADGQVYLKASNQNRFYRLDGTDIPGKSVLFRVGTAETGAQSVASAPRWPFSVHGSCYVDDQVKLSEPDVNFKQNTETIYSVYHADSTLLSNFRFTVLYSTKKSSSTLPHGINYTYFATVCVDDIVFNHVLDGKVITGTNGSLYLVLYLENEVELYRITPGHTEGLKLGALEEKSADKSAEETGEDSSAQMQKATGEQPIEPNAFIPVNPNHIATVGYTEALNRAEEMINKEWTLRKEHKEKKEGVELPAQIAAAAPGTKMHGIPYCYGGYNGLETVGRWQEFSIVIEGDVIAGNVKHIENGGHIPGTVGLDCSGFVSSAFKQSTHIYSGDYRSLGCLATFLNQLRAGDILVTKSAGDDRHVMIYNRTLTNAQGQFVGIEVYDCTGGTGITEQQANKRTILFSSLSSFMEKYYLRIALATKIVYNTQGHWKGCSMCSTSTMMQAHTYNASKVCTVCGYYGGTTIQPGM